MNNMNDMIGDPVIPTEEITADEIKATELEKLFMECLVLEKKHKDQKAKTAEIWHDLEGKQLKLGNLLETMGREDYSFKYGTFAFIDTQGDLTPKTLEQKQAFKEYIEARGYDYMAMLSINANTLKKFCKEERALADENGEMLMQIPGIELGSVTRKFKQKQTKHIPENV